MVYYLRFLNILLALALADINRMHSPEHYRYTCHTEPEIPLCTWLYSQHTEQEVLGRTNHLLSLIRHGPHRRRRLQQFFVAAGTCLPSLCLAMIGGYRQNYGLFFVMTWIAQKTTRPSIIVSCIRYRENVFTEPLPSNERGIHTD
jgi:hypothetical protein